MTNASKLMFSRVIHCQGQQILSCIRFKAQKLRSMRSRTNKHSTPVSVVVVTPQTFGGSFRRRFTLLTILGVQYDKNKICDLRALVTDSKVDSEKHPPRREVSRRRFVCSEVEISRAYVVAITRPSVSNATKYPSYTRLNGVTRGQFGAGTSPRRQK